MLYLKSVRKRQDRASVPPLKGPNFSLSLRAWVLHPNTRRHVRLLGPCFKTGRLKPLRQHPKHVAWANPDQKACCSPRSRSPCTTRGYNTASCHIPPALFRRSKSMLAHPPRNAPSKSKAESRRTRLTSSVSLSTISRTV